MYVDRDMILGIATRYGLDGPEIEHRWGREFPYRSRPAIDSRGSLHNGDRVLFPGVNQPGRRVGHPTPSSPKLKKEYNYNLLLLLVFMASQMVSFISSTIYSMICFKISGIYVPTENEHKGQCYV